MDFCSIASGSSGNCTFVGTEHTSVLIDAGIAGKRIELGLRSLEREAAELDAILVTHEHIDHIKSIGLLSRRYGIPVYATKGTIATMMRFASLGKVDPALFHEIRENTPFSLGDLQVRAFPIHHDAAQPVGYRLEDGKSAFALATDMGSYDEDILDQLRGLDGLLLEANHDVNMLQVGPYPYPLKRRILGEYGHMSNEMAGQVLGEILHDGMKSVLLGHLSKENNYEALAYATVTSEITLGDNPYRGEDFDIQVASREHPSQCFHL